MAMSQSTIVLFGKKSDLKRFVGNHLLKKNAFTDDTTECQQEEGTSYTIIYTPDIEENNHPNQLIIDCMALSYPGPHAFLLVIPKALEGQKTQDEVEEEVKWLARNFDKSITKNLIVVSSDNDIPKALDMPKFKICTTDDLDKHLADLKSPVKYSYDRYSEDIVKHRSKTLRGKRKALDDSSSNNPKHADRGLEDGDSRSKNLTEIYGGSPYNPRIVASNPSNTLDIVLLGQTGSGKSASGNTILGTKYFVSCASASPVTRDCQVREIHMCGRHVRVIDTPDFFDEAIDLSVRKEQIEKCRKLCQSDSCVYLLAIQVGRFTDGERDLLRELQKVFGDDITTKMIVLFTRGEDLKDSIEEFLTAAESHLKDMVQHCEGTYHVFRNKDHNEQQVKELMEKIRKISGP